MNCIETFITEHSDQIWTIISVIIGGLITYLTTYFTEKRKEKRENKKLKVNEVFIPFCTTIEKTIGEFKRLYQNDDLKSEDVFKLWLANLEEPLKFLKAEKIVYLSEELTKQLESYEKDVKALKNAIEKDLSNFRSEYHRYIVGIVEKYSMAPKSMNINISIDNSCNYSIIKAILTQQEISLKYKIDEVTYIINDDPDNNKCNNFNFKNGIYEAIGAIENGIFEIEDIKNDKAKATCCLGIYILEHTQDEKDIIISILDSMTSNKLLASMLDILYKMQQELNSKIKNFYK